MSLNQSFISDFSEYSRWTQKSKQNINCTMVDVRGNVLRPLHCTTPAAGKENKNKKMSFFKSNENIHEKETRFQNFTMIIDIYKNDFPINIILFFFY